MSYLANNTTDNTISDASLLNIAEGVVASKSLKTVHLRQLVENESSKAVEYLANSIAKNDVIEEIIWETSSGRFVHSRKDTKN